METKEQKLAALLKKTGCKWHEFRVYGSHGHAICDSLDSANRIAMILGKVSEVTVKNSVREIKDKNRVHGYRLKNCYTTFFKFTRRAS